ncbi:TlpA disulfide reductase family protein [Pseudopedobacter sp.]|uniref:TlpA family protein disulfide reductase n=1 Tax=Pseudopedobacter sp. TaxID=1936787 RepID=UPI0033407118
MKKIWKENWGFIIAVIAMAFILFNMKTRTFVTQQLFRIGLFSPSLSKKDVLGPIDKNIAFTSAEGKLIKMGDLEGKVVFLNFWATWCPPCIAEMPSIQKLYNQMSNEIEFVFVDVDGQFEKPLSFLKKHNYNLPLFVSASPIPETVFDGSLPTTLVIDKKGNVVFRHRGMSDYSDKSFVAKLRQLAAE